MISFLFEINYKLSKRKKIKEWLCSIAQEEGSAIEQLSFLFVNDETILNYNKKYLSHNYYTDIITFNNSENTKISGDVIISLERVMENANKFDVSIEEELRRVMVHGLLHLLGYDDKNKKELKKIREKENHYLKKF